MILTRNREEEDCGPVCLPILNKPIYNYCPFVDFIALDLEQEQVEKGVIQMPWISFHRKLERL